MVPSKHLPQMVECGFEYRLGLDLSGFCRFLKFVVGCFVWVLRPPPPPPPSLHWLMVSTNDIKGPEISALSNLTAEMSLRISWQTRCT